MNYAQEKYDRANSDLNRLTGWVLPNEDWDQLLSVFATVPQVTLEDVAKMDELERSPLSLAEIERDALNAVLAKQGPMITKEPTVTLLDPTGGPSMEVPASVVHPMEYHLANQKSTICKECGSLVGNMGRHNLWHKEKEPSK
jgi:hypothetical protein